MRFIPERAALLIEIKYAEKHWIRLNRTTFGAETRKRFVSVKDSSAERDEKRIFTISGEKITSARAEKDEKKNVALKIFDERADLSSPLFLLSTGIEEAASA